MPDQIATVDAATVAAPLREPIHFGAATIVQREFALVRVRAQSGAAGYAFTLTRDGPVAAIVERLIAPRYAGASVDDPAALFTATQAANLATFANGVGLRALSIVDIAAWDLLGQVRGEPIERLLGGRPRPLPAAVVVGYPPSLDAAATAVQVRELRAAGWRRFKLPIAPDVELTRARVAAAAAAAEGDWLGLDAAWSLRRADEAATLLDSLDTELGWLEDVFPPGNVAALAELRRRVRTPIAMGDEQGGAYFPEALLAAAAVDVVRLDLTCAGGISRARDTIAAIERAGAAVSPHMGGQLHSRVFAGLGCDAPIEWGMPGTGVDPYADSLTQPEIRDGAMEPLPETPGIGPMTNKAWLSEQRLDDPAGIVASLPD